MEVLHKFYVSALGGGTAGVLTYKAGVNVKRVRETTLTGPLPAGLLKKPTPSVAAGPANPVWWIRVTCRP